MTTLVSLKSGRKLGIAGFGDPASRRLVVLCLPSPGSGVFDPAPLVTDRFDVHVVTINRPGYDGSELVDDPEQATVASAADDIAEYLAGIDHAAARGGGGDIEPVGVVGWGWGGATALSLAGRYPSLVDRLVVIGLPKPSRARRGESAPSAAELVRPKAITSVFAAAETLPDAGRDDLAQLGISEDDPGLLEFGALSRVENLVESNGGDPTLGLAWDRISARDSAWPDDLAAITADTVMLYGDRDPVATESDGGWYRRHIPGARLMMAPGVGRLAIVSFWEDILAHVVPGSPSAWA